MDRYINVVVDLPLKNVDKPFTYKLPQRLSDKVVIGDKVLVPFGNRRIEGYVVGEGKKGDFEAKEIIKVFPFGPYFSKKMLDLARWISDYYQCYLVSSLKAMVPSGKVKVKKKRVVVLAQSIKESKEIVESLKSRAPKQAKLLSYLIDNPEDRLISTKLAQKVNTTSSTVSALVNKGFLEYRNESVRRDPFAHISFKKTEAFSPTSEQKIVIKEIIEGLKGDRKPIMLKGVTGSGKTEVYLQAIDRVLRGGREAIVLVPEISLTPQTVARFKGRFGEKVGVLHSQLSSGERFDEWRRIKEGKIKVVIGARSAVFAPFNNLGLIVIDEEHESTYKQEDHPKYHAREVAVMRAKKEGALVLMGTATPSLESYHRAKDGKYKLIELTKRVKGRPLPPVEIVDMREELKEGNKLMFSRSLYRGIEQVLDKGEQAMIFLNRRGFSTFVQCRECGHVMKCINCDLSLKYHAQERGLRCHYCDYQEKVPRICPECESLYIKYFGVGTQKVEESLNEEFPTAKVARMDVDTTRRKGSYERILSKFKSGEIDILIGTQMIAKGHDFANVTLVGVVTADTSLNLPDFRAGERTFQLLTQVAGRTGRGDKLGKVIIQSYTPDHYSIQFAKDHNYDNFYEAEIAFRNATAYPPFSSMINIVISHKDEAKVIKNTNKLGEILRSKILEMDSEEIMILGPVQAPLAKVRREFRWQIILKGKDIGRLRDVNNEALIELKEIMGESDIKVSVDVDPLTML
ncbi:primosomal protein N' [Halonatronum saccharophilum]|uniref:primosomal protein N' n=1 Tax=Halonatronum saccharophilum TaxID=150060 RepID=UPI000481E705|nr:primosomal protein N' [Halonatronum saccharophilum]